MELLAVCDQQSAKLLVWSFAECLPAVLMAGRMLTALPVIEKSAMPSLSNFILISGIWAMALSFQIAHRDFCRMIPYPSN